MAVQQISAKQVAELVTSLARGRTVAQTPSRLHMAESVVEEIGRLNGFPNATELNRNSRILNKRLRDALPEEDVDTDVPVTPETDTQTDNGTATSNSGVFELEVPADDPTSVGVAEPEVDEPDVVLWRCVRRGCGYELSGPKSAGEDDVQHAIQLHKQTHHDQGSTVVIPGPVHVGHHANERRPHDCAACRDEAVEPPVIVPGEVVDEFSSVAAAVDELVSTLGSYECPVDGCDFTLHWAGQSEDPEDDREVDDYIDQQIADHEEWHRSGVEVAHVPNGHSVPTQVGALLGDMVHVLAEAVSTDSPGPLPPVEVVPDAADVATSEQHGVRDARGPFEHARTEGGWEAAGPRTVERLLDEAARTGHEPIMELAARIRGDLQLLADRLDRWVDLADQRRAILHELDILGRRQDELTEKLARLDADTDQPPVVVASQTLTMFAQAKTDLAAAILEDKANEAETQPAGFKVFPKPTGTGFNDRTALWFQLDTEVRGRIKGWCEENGVEHAPTGRQPRAAVEAYLAAHPEDDPRLKEDQ